MYDMNNPFTLNNKTILVTGASSGIGRVTAILCSQMGARVVATGRNYDRLSETFASLAEDGHVKLQADLTDSESRASLVKALPALDGIVYCAGIGQRKLAVELAQQDIQDVMDANFTSIVLLQAELMANKRINKGASIVFLSSRTADIPTIANSLYSASKGALKSYSKCLSLELAPRKIRVNCICPAMVWTPLVLQGNVSEEDLREQEKRYPLKRYGQPQDIANLAVFLLSDASGWMTGSCIDITGGAINI